MFSILIDIFGEMLCPFQNAEMLTLNLMWFKKWQVIVFYHNSLVSSHAKLWPGCFIPSPWPNTTKINHLLNILEEDFKMGRCNSKFFVTQGVLTPSNLYFIRHLNSSLKNDLAEKVAGLFTHWLQKKHAGENGINVCIMDFVDMAGYIPIVIGLNYQIKPVRGDVECV